MYFFTHSRFDINHCTALTIYSKMRTMCLYNWIGQKKYSQKVWRE